MNIWFHLQVKQRADECILALDKLTEINSGRPVQNVLRTQFDWSTLEVNFSLFLNCQQSNIMQDLGAKHMKHRMYNKTETMRLAETSDKRSWSVSAVNSFFLF